MSTPILARPLSRRSVLGSAALAGGALAFPSLALARNAPEWPSVRSFIDSYVGRDKVAGMVAGLGWQQRDPAFIAEGDVAFSSDVPVGPDTLWRIYSMTKPITAMAAMMLISEGRLGLDQELADILPAFAQMQVQRQYDGPITPDNLEPAVRPITIRHLLTHTAGLGYGIVQQGPIARLYRDRGLVPGAVSRLEMPGIFRGRPAGSLAVFADRLAEAPLVYQPGERWSYSVGLDLLGRVIEVVAGQPFDAFLQERILDPCGMDSTFFRVPESETDRFTANYFLVGNVLLPIDLPGSSIFLDEPAFPFGGAGLVSSARDYDRFLQMIVGHGRIEGRRVMSEDAVRLATSNLLPDTLAPGGGFSFGEMEFGYGAGGLVGKGEAAGLYGWFGAAGTCGLVNMRLGLRHCLMTQYMPAEAYGVYSEFPAAVARDAMAMAGTQ
jgi:CubicO group peptidase (beta-lactamase class C family)